MPRLFRTPLTLQHSKEKTHTLRERRHEFIQLAKLMDDLLNQLDFLNFIREVNSHART